MKLPEKTTWPKGPSTMAIGPLRQGPLGHFFNNF